MPLLPASVSPSVRSICGYISVTQLGAVNVVQRSVSTCNVRTELTTPVVWRESQKKRTAGELLGMAIHPLSGVHLRGWLSSVPIWMGLNLQHL